MDTNQFDALVRAWGRGSRRGVLRLVTGSVATLLLPFGGKAATKRPAKRSTKRPAKQRQSPRGERLSAQGPCGDGSVKANTCTRNNQCCIGSCNRKTRRCRCRHRGQSCFADRNCCARGGQTLTCQDRICRGVRPDTTCDGGPCRVFVTSVGFDGVLGGLDGADATCQELAADANLPGTYRAWLSDPDGSPATRFTRSTRPYVLVDDAATRIADDWDDLTDGTLAAPINVTEGRSGEVDDYVWTNTQTDGTAGSDNIDDDHCDFWSTAGSGGGLYGYTGDVGGNWTDVGESALCDETLRLYCFQQ